jgi:hypothetical protein
MSDVFFKTRNMNNSSSSETKTTDDGSKTKERPGGRRKRETQSSDAAAAGCVHGDLKRRYKHFCLPAARYVNLGTGSIS